MQSTRRKGVFALVLVMLAVAGLTACRRPRPPGPSTTTTPVTTPTTPTTAPSTSTTQPTPPANEQSKTLRYGPYTVPASANGHAGMIENKIAFNVARPCDDCYITGMQASLVRASDGTTVNVSEGLWLHHIVMMDQSKQDLTCPGRGPGLLGQRFFSSGNERSPAKSLGKYGYPQPGDTARWNLIYDLMNMTAQPEDVVITITFDYVPIDTPGYRAMTPIWFDINQCGNSERPALEGTFTYDYTLTSQWNGKLIGIGGHLHDGGVNLTITKNGELVCDSRATYGGTPAYIEGPSSVHMPGMKHISEMSRCQGSAEKPVTTIKVGDVFKLEANYDMTQHHADGHPVMGIAIGYFDLG